MIDIEKANREFDKYVSQFNPEEGRIKLKIDHIKRVAQISKELAQNLKLNDEEIKLAELIGLFHDIGRFKQAELYNTFNDRISINHAELSVKILFEDNLISKFDIEEKYKRIIKLAILNHNRYKIDYCGDDFGDGAKKHQKLNDTEMLFAKLIRDADKLDIYYTICEYDFPSIFWYKDFDTEEINEAVMNNFTNNHYVDYSDIKNNSDQIPIFYAYVFDFNFDFSLAFLREKNYLEKFTQRVYEHFKNEIVKKQVEQILEITNTFIEEKLENMVCNKK